MNAKAAVFLDRDGTLIHDPGFLKNPGAVELLPGAAQAVAELNRAGLLAIVVTNQSGIARGLITPATYQAIESRVDELLQAQGAHLDAHYYCPHLPEISGACECRKPGTLLYRKAAERFGIDFGASWWIGDRLRDVEPAGPLGGRGILITSELSRSDHDSGERFSIAPSLAAAVRRIVG
jgi:D-glycero-D-manno-heptose 1,7-bisphosphate phosphatase